MSDMAPALPPTRTPAFEARLKKRYAAERRFKALGLSAILFSIAVLLFLLVTMTLNGFGGFQRAEMKVAVDFPSMGIALNPSISDPDAAVRSLQGQGLPEIIAICSRRIIGHGRGRAVEWRGVADRCAPDRRRSDPA